MALVKNPPSVAAAKRDIEDVLDRFIRTPFGALDIFPFAQTTEAFAPALDLVETEKEYTVRMEVPGIPKENLDVNLVGRTLTVSGHREKVTREPRESMLWEEREYGSFTRTVRLPGDVVEGKIEALCQDGILSVHLPKTEPTVKSKIMIKS
ncbi:MAG TPA: Hsp20/alpha crystallin family protein [Gemmatimonadales bacterium]|jgi:HSP20 family protein|nr:Hsp20/alpha crystallin family protein [Gemmatimonadales bacterium]